MPPARTIVQVRRQAQARRQEAAAPRRRPARAARSSSWRPRLPVARAAPPRPRSASASSPLGVFLAFPLYLRLGRRRRRARRSSTGCAWAVGAVAYAAPVALVAAGALLVLRPVLPAVRPFRAGALCLLPRRRSPRRGHARSRRRRRPGRVDNGGVCEAAAASARRCTGRLDALLGASARTSSRSSSPLAGVLLLTGASVAGVLRATPPRRRRDDPRACGATAAGPTEADDGREAPPAESPTRAARARRARSRSCARATDRRRRPLDGALRYPDLFGDAPLEVAVTAAAGGRGAASPSRGREPGAAARPSPSPSRPPASPRGPRPRPTERPSSREQLDLELRGRRQDFALPEPRSSSAPRPSRRAPTPPARSRPPARLIEALGHLGVAGAGHRRRRRPAHHPLRAAARARREDGKVANLKNDLAYALAATEIRILAPIPGKRAVGVEVPNRNRRIVTLGDVLGDAPPKGSSPLTVWLGKDVTGKADRRRPREDAAPARRRHDRARASRAASTRCSARSSCARRPTRCGSSSSTPSRSSSTTTRRSRTC